MRRVVCVVVLAMLASACGSLGSSSGGGCSIDPELQSYYDEFKADHKEITGNELTCENFSAGFEEMDWKYNGYCRIQSNGQAEVLINSAKWSSMGDLKKDYVLNHEFGHCLLGLGHNDSTYNNLDTDIMGTYAMSEFEYGLIENVLKINLHSRNTYSNEEIFNVYTLALNNSGSLNQDREEALSLSFGHDEGLHIGHHDHDHDHAHVEEHENGDLIFFN